MDKVKLDLSNIQAVIFDLNGTMVDDMTYHKKAWIEFCSRHGLNLTSEEFEKKFSGRKNSEILPLILNKPLSQDQIIKYSEDKEQIYREIYAQFIKEVPGLRNFILKLRARNYKIAIATTAFEKNRKFILENLGLENLFNLILGEEHVIHGKPDPEIYLKTAEQLGVDPSRCLVFEDSPPGVESGKSAEMKVIGILTTHTKEDLIGASICIKDFTQLEIN
ncbi:MAG: HAD family phosphatase [Patescibacteria group bacterium]